MTEIAFVEALDSAFAVTSEISAASGSTAAGSRRRSVNWSVGTVRPVIWSTRVTVADGCAATLAAGFGATVTGGFGADVTGGFGATVTGGFGADVTEPAVAANVELTRQSHVPAPVVATAVIAFWVVVASTRTVNFLATLPRPGTLTRWLPVVAAALLPNTHPSPTPA